MNKRVLGVVLVLVGLCVAGQVARLVMALLRVPPAPMAVAPRLADNEPSCGDEALKAEYAKQQSAMKYEDWCGASIAGPRLMWRNQHINSVSDATICSWKSAYHVALKCETQLPEDDAFLVASSTIDEVGAESLSWVVRQWRDEGGVPRDIIAFRKLGLEQYAVILEKAKAAGKDKAKLDALDEEWAALEKQNVFENWFERECPSLVTCKAR